MRRSRRSCRISRQRPCHRSARAGTADITNDPATRLPKIRVLNLSINLSFLVFYRTLGLLDSLTGEMFTVLYGLAWRKRPASLSFCCAILSAPQPIPEVVIKPVTGDR